jgi:ATP-dependent Lon protease
MKVKKDKQVKMTNGKELFDDSINEKTNLSVVNNKSEIEIYDIQKAKTVLENQTPRSPLALLIKKLVEEGNVRHLQVATKAVSKEIEKLVNKFPNFSDVINFVVKNLALASLSRPAIISLPPILLIGPPGIGKTRFLNELSTLFRLDFYQIDLASVTSGFVLSGNSTSWADGKPGLVVDYLRTSKSANYICLLDEIDKASTDSRYDPLSSLYTLLEKKTATKFVDEALTIPMDCSHINWFASANYSDAIPTPIQSRFNTFRIKEPTIVQKKMITNSVYRDILSDNPWGHKFKKALNADVTDKITELSARKQKSVLITACAEAAYKRNKKSRRLLEIGLKDLQLLDESAPKRAIGFL